MVISILFTMIVSKNTYGSGAATIENSANDTEITKGRLIWKKSKCAFCHGWAGDGHGHPRSPGVASNLRASYLDRSTMKEIIRCGLPGTVMPYHDRQAYKQDLCLYTKVDDLKRGEYPNYGANIRDEDMDKLVQYIFSDIKGHGPITLEECEMYFKPGSRNCLQYQ